jgi:glutathione S-transferase
VLAGIRSTAVVAGPLLRLRFGIKPETADLGWAKTYAAMDRLEAELGGRDYLVGDAFTVADLTAASLFFPIVRPDEAQYPAPEPLPEAIVERREELAPRPGFGWVQEMYRRHRGQSAEVPA